MDVGVADATVGDFLGDGEVGWKARKRRKRRWANTPPMQRATRMPMFWREAVASRKAKPVKYEAAAAIARNRMPKAVAQARIRAAVLRASLLIAGGGASG